MCTDTWESAGFASWQSTEHNNKRKDTCLIYLRTFWTEFSGGYSQCKAYSILTGHIEIRDWRDKTQGRTEEEKRGPNEKEELRAGKLFPGRLFLICPFV